MESIYTQEFKIADIHVDRYGKLKLSTLLYFAQEVAGRHFDRIAMTYEQLMEKGMFWAIIRQRVAITRLPMSGETIRVETWPMPNTRVAFPRHVAAYDEKGNQLFRCISLWVLIDVESIENHCHCEEPKATWQSASPASEGCSAATGRRIPLHSETIIY